MFTGEEIVIEIVRKSKKSKKIIYKYFNKSQDCFGCNPIAHVKLIKACEMTGIDLNKILEELNIWENNYQ